jgi:hypothetical protein
MNQCSDAVWRLATEVMEANKKKDDTLDAVAEKLHMFSHITPQEGTTLAEGERPVHTLKCTPQPAARSQHARRPTFCQHSLDLVPA